jgi:hypothetical protein
VEEDVDEEVEEGEAEAEEVARYPEAEEDGVKEWREEAVAQVRIRFRRRRWWWWWRWRWRWRWKWRDGCGHEAGGGRGRGIAPPRRVASFVDRQNGFSRLRCEHHSQRSLGSTILTK